MARIRGAGLALALVGLMALPARAGVFEDMGVSGRDVAMAGSVAADDPTYTAAFYNPALLVLQKKFGFGFGGLVSRTFTSVEKIGGSGTLDCTHCRPPATYGFHVGLLFPLAGKVKNYLSLGLLMYKPGFRLIHISAADPSRPFWYRYQDEDRFAMFLGMGIKIVDGLTIGVGAQFLADLVGGGATIGMDMFSKQFKLRELDSYLGENVSPTAGIYWSPDPAISLAFSFRGSRSVYFELPAQMDLTGIGTMDFIISGYSHYTPNYFTLAGAYRPEPGLLLTGSLVFAMWKQAPTPFMSVNVQLGGPTLEALGLADALGLASPESKPGFANTLSGAIGLEYQVSDGFYLRGGAFYRPTPVPRQDVPGTNILDSTAVGVSGGFEVQFGDPLEIFSQPISFEVGVRAAYLFPRTADKESTDPVPSYSYQALSLGGVVDLRYNF